MAKRLDAQRTYALAGAGGAGKTSLAEMLLHTAGALSRLGSIEEGATCLDYEPEEIKRRGSIQPAVAQFAWNKSPHYLLDTPGENNFIGDIPLLFTAADAVLFCVDAVDGARPLARKLWQQAAAAGLPGMICITKLDRDRADFSMAYASLGTVLGVKPVLLHLPIGQQDHFVGVVDLMANKALLFQKDGTLRESDIPEELADEAATLRETAIENIAESDEVLMEKYLDAGELSIEDIRTGLHAGVLNRSLVPVVVSAAVQNKGGALILDTIQQLFPSPLERGPWLGQDGSERASSDAEPPAAFVFKTLSDPFAGQLSLVRVLSGTFTADTSYLNSRTGDTERVGQLLQLLGKSQTPTKEAAECGAIVAVAKLKNTATGDTLAAEKKPFALAAPAIAPPLLTYALAPKEKGEEDKVYQAVQKLLEEDITLRLSRDEESSDILLSGMGQMHIETAVERARRRYKVDIVLKTPKVPYRETIKGTADVQGRHKKQSGGRGQFGDCWVKFEPLPRGAGYQYVDAIVGGVIPRQYIPAVDKGIQESAHRGFLAGCPMVDFKASCHDGSYHTVDSSEMAFKIAGSLAFKKAMETAKPVLLEPIMQATISIPDEYMGDVIGDLSSRRGKVLGSDSTAGVTEIKAHVPMNEMLRYAPDLRAMTAGQGTFAMEFDHYEEAPPPVAEKVIAEYQKERGGE
ncbi:elongation factor G [Megalodesulfovibrio gigas]|uniref:Elongation factor G n=1 Tax=Megalodesulfovibrio gigas (strain ATCC 19364 / DSM 1382 / NCIMB 9332 / VKM B-1759) TaxID=1121448 RepID=T2GAV9_MEGG1|nr:elongation factor G [Megalodesulfovibrio gigas]AGW13428.1 putative elongation factor G [Megalodesulfovibrio gigas DSM 1382 = ATCC 19364]